MAEKVINRYVVLWIPKKLYGSVLPLSKLEIEAIKEDWSLYDKKIENLPVLCDNGEMKLNNVLFSEPSEPSYNKLYLDLILLNSESDDPSVRSIVVKCKKKINSEDEYATLFLRCEQTSQDGLVKYSYNYDDVFDKDNVLFNRKGNIIHAVYHAIKSFYHIHEFHDDDKDSILEPFCTNKDINIKNIDNEALMHYLNYFEMMFYGFVKDFSSQSISLANRNVKKARILKAYRYFLKRCTNAIGIGDYVNVLLLSKSNKSFFASFRDEYPDEHRIRSFYTGPSDQRTFSQKSKNLYLSIEYLKILKDRALYSLNLVESKMSVRLTEIASFLTVFGVIFAFVSYFSTPSSCDIKDIVKKTVPSSDVIKSVIIESIEPIHNHTDDLINYNTKKLVDSIELIPQKTKTISNFPNFLSPQ